MCQHATTLRKASVKGPFHVSNSPTMLQKFPCGLLTNVCIRVRGASLLGSPIFGFFLYSGAMVVTVHGGYCECQMFFYHVMSLLARLGESQYALCGLLLQVPCFDAATRRVVANRLYSLRLLRNAKGVPTNNGRGASSHVTNAPSHYGNFQYSSVIVAGGYTVRVAYGCFCRRGFLLLSMGVPIGRSSP